MVQRCDQAVSAYTNPSVTNHVVCHPHHHSILPFPSIVIRWRTSISVQPQSTKILHPNNVLGRADGAVNILHKGRATAIVDAGFDILSAGAVLDSRDLYLHKVTLVKRSSVRAERKHSIQNVLVEHMTAAGSLEYSPWMENK